MISTPRLKSFVTDLQVLIDVICMGLLEDNGNQRQSSDVVPFVNFSVPMGIVCHISVYLISGLLSGM